MHKSLAIMALTIISLSSSPLAARQLAGVYTIGTGGDYLTIADAVSDLETLGISDDVVFNFKPGVYDEQIVLGSFVSHNDPTDLVLFDGDDAVTWQYTAIITDELYVLDIQDVSYVTFTGIKWLGGNHPGVTPQNLVRIKPPGVSTVEHLSFIGNEFDAEGELLHTPALFGVFAGFFDMKDIIVTNNVFKNGRSGVALRWHSGCCTDPVHENFTISNNTFTEVGKGGTAAQHQYAIETGEVTNVIIQGNQISNLGDVDGMAINLFDVVQLDLSGNSIKMSGSNTRGIFLTSEFNPTTIPDFDWQVYNNFVTATKAWTGSGPGLDINHNTFQGRVSTGNTGTILSRFTNNIISNPGGQAFSSSTASLMFIDRNNYYNNSSPGLLSIDGNVLDDIESWKDHPTLELDKMASSVAVNFVNLSTNDLRLTGASIGDHQLATEASSLVDIDGTARDGNTLAYKGAHEPATPLTPMNNADTGLGFYTVNGASPDYANIEEALDDLHHRGMSGPVNFKLSAGAFTYSRLPGYSWRQFARYGNIDDLLTIESVGLTKPELIGTMNLHRGLRHAHLRNLELSGHPASDRLFIRDNSDIDNLTFEDMMFDGDFVSINSTATDITILNSSFIGGSIEFQDAVGTDDGSEISIIGNDFTGQDAAAVSIIDRDNVLLSKNSFVSSVADVKGFYLEDVDGAIIEENTLNVNSTGASSYGIDLFDVRGTPSTPVRIVNNGIIAGTRGLSIVEGNDYQIYHNTILGKDNSFTKNTALHLSDLGGSVEVRNNILDHDASGLSVVANNLSSPSFDDNNHNNAAPASPLIFWEGVDYLDLGSFNTATSQGSSSTSEDVIFVNQVNGDLHLAGASNGNSNLGANPQGINFDIDEELRSNYSPYKGFDEASIPIAPSISLSLKIFLSGPFDTSSSMKTELNSGGVLETSALNNPYQVAPWSYLLDDAVAPGFFASHPDVVDWVYVQLLSGTVANPNPAYAAVGLLMSDGSVKSYQDATSDLRFPTSGSDFFVKVFHRNHLAIRTPAKIDFSSGSASYDFTDAITKAYSNGGAPMTEIDGVYALWGGDGDANNAVSAFDFLNSWLPINGSATGYYGGDFDMNGSPTAFDFLTTWLPANGQAAQ